MASRRIDTRWNKTKKILLDVLDSRLTGRRNIEKDQHDDIIGTDFDDLNSRNKQALLVQNMVTGKWTRMHDDCQRFNDIYKNLNRKSGESDADLVENAKTAYIDRYGKKFLYPHVWNILKNYPKWDAAEPIDADNLEELFGPDPRERPAGKQRAPKKQKSVETTSTGGVNRSLYRHLFLRIIDVNVMLLKKVYKAKREKELAIMQCKELEFLMIDPSALPAAKRAIIERKQAEIMRKYPDA
ncbi:hypothetical protein Tco_1010342 [Tanacetum coccineum]